MHRATVTKRSNLPKVQTGAQYERYTSHAMSLRLRKRCWLVSAMSFLAPLSYRSEFRSGLGEAQTRRNARSAFLQRGLTVYERMSLYAIMRWRYVRGPHNSVVRV
jgi:hypothetical protein